MKSHGPLLAFKLGIYATSKTDIPIKLPAVPSSSLTAKGHGSHVMRDWHSWGMRRVLTRGLILAFSPVRPVAYDSIAVQAFVPMKDTSPTPPGFCGLRLILDFYVASRNSILSLPRFEARVYLNPTTPLSKHNCNVIPIRTSVMILATLGLRPALNSIRVKSVIMIV
ncbi:hypothetical protein CCUS01_08629 [Colletotrichum cuscutae]|uniref:Uncharacterized protein n=1 Tax=Colletotrichum cuscutae TaxID=1209917 RepID=A0AAI9UT67_9PEZI|nr:hypothetical protein CCUS01_08629 [Colletotrichum cuscutae]